MKKLALAVLLMLPLPALAQNSVWSEPIINGSGQPIVGAGVSVCQGATKPSLVIPCGGSSPATIYVDFAGSSQQINPFFTDSNGMATVFAAPGNYWLQIFGTGLQTTLIPISIGGGGGGGGGGVNTYSGGGTTNRTGNVAYLATDPGVLGIQQVGTGTLPITTNTAGTGTFGNSGNFLTMFPTSNSAGFQLHDTANNIIVSGTSGLVGIAARTPSGTNLSLYDLGEITASLAGLGGLALDMTSSGALFNVPGNFAAGIQLANSFGTPGQVLCSTGSTSIWSSSCGGASGITTFGFTTNQFVNTGTSSNPFIALFGGSSSSPLVFPGNLQMQQFANANNAFVIQRKTDTSPTGTLMLFQTAGGSTLGTIDVLGNLTFPTLVTNGGGGGYIGFQQGTDSSAACFAASVLNGICHLAPTTVTADYAVIEPGAAPTVLSVKTSSAAVSSETTESYTPTTGNSLHVQTGDGTVAACASGGIATYDGSGNAHCSGINISAVLPSIQGPASPFTTTSLTAVTVMTYGTTIPASTTATVTCIGTYSFTGAAEEAAFALNFSSAPSVIRLNVWIGANPTTQSSLFGLQTTNGALVTSPSNASNVNIQLPVKIEGGIQTGSATTFTVVGATSNASGTLAVATNGFTCNVK